ncbi:AmmeMemoRadiSam system protein A [Candidatus Micrarchaeota archaeon]|nr:AmmeMemoRadiSam system protein A [Candidatus Micrarchaeota archaeon]
MELTGVEKKFLLSLARKSIMHYLSTGSMLRLSPADVPSKKLVENGACFVTLKMGTELRGCIGTLEAHRPLFMDAIENAAASAFGDPRFYPLSMQESSKVKISISVLTEPKELPVSGPEDLLKKLVPHKHGLIIQQGVARATFLPVVWEELPEKERFLQHLSMKAGLSPEGWKSPRTKFFIYEAIEFSE